MLTARPLLLLDEPLTGLDPAMRSEMVGLIEKFRREKALSGLMTTQTSTMSRQGPIRSSESRDGR
jgi:thiamine transport system ATP-binding protein